MYHCLVLQLHLLHAHKLVKYLAVLGSDQISMTIVCVRRQYLQDLLTYLEQFYDRTNPLGSLTKVYGKLGFDFDSAFEEGQVPGWEDRGAGKLPGQQGSAMDLQAFDTVDELESLGEHHYPCMIVYAYAKEGFCSSPLAKVVRGIYIAVQQYHRGNCTLHCECYLLACFCEHSLLSDAFRQA